MRILFVGKRRPQQRDLIERPYGRFHHLPVGLAALGHEVQVELCSHAGIPAVRQNSSEGTTWISHDLQTLGIRGLLRVLLTDARAFRPDWVIGMSDAHFGWIAQRLATACGARLGVDAYDNYEAYMPWNLPLHWLWRRAIRHADLVTAAGPQLAARLQAHRHRGRNVAILPMAADPEFVPAAKSQCRESLGLPQDAKLLGYIGSWSKSRGTPMLIDALRRCRESNPAIQLIVSGKPPQEVLGEPGVHSVGYVADALLPTLVNALDVACVVTADTSFGSFSYPAKLCEAMACRVPVVATATAAVSWMLRGDRTHLVAIGDSRALAERCLALLDKPQSDYGERVTWSEQAARLAGWLVEEQREGARG